jgi:hypothetical protein
MLNPLEQRATRQSSVLSFARHVRSFIHPRADSPFAQPMKSKLPLVVGALLFVFCSIPISADPVTFKEVSVLVRMKEPQAEIESQIAKRKLNNPFSKQELETLRAQGASDALLRILQDPRFFLSAREAHEFNRKKAAELAARLDEEKFRQAPAAKVVGEAAPAGEASTDFKYAKEAVPWGKALNISKFGGSNIDLFVKNRTAFYGVDIAKNERSSPAVPAAVEANGTNPAIGIPNPPAMASLSTARTRVRIEKRGPVKIPTERGDLYLIYFDKPSGLHVYYLDDQAAPVNTDVLIVSPKKFN